MRVHVDVRTLVDDIVAVCDAHACVPDSILLLGATLYVKTMREVVRDHGATQQLQRLVEASEADQKLRAAVRDTALLLTQTFRDLGEQVLTKKSEVK